MAGQPDFNQLRQAYQTIVMALAGQRTQYTQRRGSQGAGDNDDDDEQRQQPKPKPKPVEDNRINCHSNLSMHIKI